MLSGGGIEQIVRRADRDDTAARCERTAATAGYEGAEYQCGRGSFNEDHDKIAENGARGGEAVREMCEAVIARQFRRQFGLRR